jgi:hypothetical protein
LLTLRWAVLPLAEHVTVIVPLAAAVVLARVVVTRAGQDVVSMRA